MIFLPFEKMHEEIFEEPFMPQILKIVHSFNRPTWILNSHSHPDQTEILYVAGGKGIYTVSNIPYHAKTGDIIIFNSNVVHSMESDYQDPLDVWSCSLRGFQLKNMQPNDLLPVGMLPVLPTNTRGQIFQDFYMEIFQQRNEQNPGYYSVCTYLAVLLILLTRQLIEEQMCRRTKEKDSFAAEVIRYLDEHYREPITMETLSQIFHMSPSHISHEVTSAFEKSPINYLIDRRIREAQWELVSTKYTLKEIAEHVGYENTNHFCNLFARRTGMKPAEFRTIYTK